MNSAEAQEIIEERSAVTRADFEKVVKSFKPDNSCPYCGEPSAGGKVCGNCQAEWKEFARRKYRRRREREEERER